MSRSGFLASHPSSREAVEKVLASGGGAVKAALTGYYAAAGADAGVLFGPSSLLIGGVGSGVVAYDGRCRQPGRDAKRPRGFLPEEELPQAALVAAPTSVFASAVALAFHPGTTLLACVRPGIQVAKAVGAQGRADLLETVATLGATAMREPSIKKAFLSQFGAIEGGALTATDLVAPEGLQVAATAIAGHWAAPWQSEGMDVANSQIEGHGIVVADSHGIFVSLSFGSLKSGLMLDPYEVEVPCFATPVLRGVTRISPGTAIDTWASARIDQDSSGRIVGASLIPRSGAAPLRLVRNPDTREVSVGEVLAFD